MQELIDEIRIYVKERNWDALEPSDLAKSISIESAEILEHFQWKNHTTEELKADKEKFHELTMEVADVFIYLLQMSMVLGIKPEDIIREKLEYVRKKYPADKVRANRSEYLKIKKEYRKNND